MIISTVAWVSATTDNEPNPTAIKFKYFPAPWLDKTEYALRSARGEVSFRGSTISSRVHYSLTAAANDVLALFGDFWQYFVWVHGPVEGQEPARLHMQSINEAIQKGQQVLNHPPLYIIIHFIWHN